MRTRRQRERDDALLSAENEKQQVLSRIELEKSSLQEKLGIAQDELSGLGLEYERLKRDALAKQEQDRHVISELQAEFKNFRQQFEEKTLLHEKEVRDFSNQVQDRSVARDAALREIAELKVQLKMVEESRDVVRKDMMEANRKIREADELIVQLRKEIANRKRMLADEVREKETRSWSGSRSAATRCS